MKLNRLESKFFEDILKTELDVPVHATLEYGETVLDIIVVPEINDQGHFLLKYFNASPYEPKPDASEVATLSMREFFGVHPSLEQAWRGRDSVTVQLKTAPGLPRPFYNAEQPQLNARVYQAGTHNRGELVLDENQVVVKDSLLRRAEFCVVDLPDMNMPFRLEKNPAKIITERDIIFESDKWRIVLTADEDLTRDLVSWTGLIEKSNGSEYEIGELDDVLQGLQYFFAFVAGVYRFPTVVIGYGTDDQPVWGKLGRFDVKSLGGNWFRSSSTRHTSEFLEALFSQFWCQWMKRKDEIISIVERYVHSNIVGRIGAWDTALVMSYTGMEVIARLVLGSDANRNDKGYKTSSQKINRALDRINESDCIVRNIVLDESRTPRMAALAENLSVKNNGPWLLGEVRNYVVHPLERTGEERYKELDSDPSLYVYLHDLSQFYFEYMFLAFLGLPDVQEPRILLERSDQI